MNPENLKAYYFLSKLDLQKRKNKNLHDYQILPLLRVVTGNNKFKNSLFPIRLMKAENYIKLSQNLTTVLPPVKVEIYPL